MPQSEYGKVLQKLYSLEKFGSRLGLNRIKKILALLSNPQNSYKSILVAGSNGKGSTVHMIGSILCSDGKRAGTFFSPHICEFAERIRICGKNARRKDIVRSYLQVIKICKKNNIRATFFEVITAMAFLIFKWNKVGFAVLEVGLGGRLDATNAANAKIGAITSISLEHTARLGSTIEKIAYEKCGIARKGIPVVCGNIGKRAQKAVERECRKRGAKPVFVSKSILLGNEREKDGKYSFDATFSGTRFCIQLCAPGRFQISNACVALAASFLCRASKKAIEKGLCSAVPKFRLQAISKFPLVIADCAHNPEGAAALAKEVKRIKARKKVLLFSAMKDKHYGTVLRKLSKEFDMVVLTKVSTKRAARLLSMKRAVPRAAVVKNPGAALRKAKKMAGKPGAVIIAGSIYLLAELFNKDKIRIVQ